jgi:hypothetical protein
LNFFLFKRLLKSSSKLKLEVSNIVIQSLSKYDNSFQSAQNNKNISVHSCCLTSLYSLISFHNSITLIIEVSKKHFCSGYFSINFFLKFQIKTSSFSFCLSSLLQLKVSAISGLIFGFSQVFPQVSIQLFAIF